MQNSKCLKKIEKSFLLLFVGLCLAGCLFSLQKAKAVENLGAFEINDFVVDIHLDEKGVMIVREEIVVDYYEPRHGIFRNIPIKYRDDKAFLHNFRFKLLSVTNKDGSKWKYTKYGEEEDMVIKIGDPNKKVDGRQVYIIEYKITRGLRFFEDHTEIYWNPVGTGWPTTIDHAIANVHIPGDVVFVDDDLICFTGSFGSKKQNCTQKVISANHLQFETRDKLEAHEGLTFAVRFPTEIVQRPGLWMRILWFVSDNWGFAMPIVVFGLIYAVWKKRGQELNLQKTTIVQYEPPENLTPGEVAYLVKERYLNNSVTADIVNLAVKGFLKINEIEDNSTIGKIKKNTKIIPIIISLGILVMALFFVVSAMFLVGDESKSPLIFSVVFMSFFVFIAFANSKKFKKVMTSSEYEVENIKDWRGDSNLTIHEQILMKGMFGSQVGKKVLVKKMKKFHEKVTDARKKLKKQIKEKGYFENHLLNSRVVWILLGIAVGVGTLMCGSVFERVDIVIGGFLSSIVLFIFGAVMSKKTHKGAEAYRWAKGFEDYIKTAERYRVKFQEDEKIFEKVLPYAMVLGLADKWAKAFEGIYENNPDWYSSLSAQAFHPALFASSLNDNFGSATQSVSNPPSSSSSGFSGGGGSSGGGGGGGGGGSW
ncbi:MAG: DUF2207 domain-containing protein [Patescibacteria group bacterium]|nr:DUF2207 domain-containing protein [Patescibacteria group bacterium]